MGTDGTIVHVAAGSQSVDTDHLKNLVGVVTLATSYTTFATADLVKAMATAPSELLSGLEHTADVTADIALLLGGGHSIRALGADLVRLTQTLTQLIGIYVEAEQTAARQIGKAFPGSVSQVLGPKSTILGLLVIGGGSFLSSYTGFTSQGSATQFGTRNAARLIDLRTRNGRYFTSDGEYDAAELTPVQRTAIALMRRTGIDRFNGGINLRELPSRAFEVGGRDIRDVPPDFDTLVVDGRLPASTIAAMGSALGYSHLTGPVAYTGSNRPRHPNTTRGMTEYLADSMNDLNYRGGEQQEQIIRIDRIEKPDGTVQHLVFIPGTTAGNDLFTKNPASHDGNVNLVGGIDADASRAILRAMDAAGIAPGDNVALFGHSQGGITAQNFAANETFTKKYNVNYVVTAGAPSGGKVVDPSIPTFHLEEADDEVPSLDGAANHSSPNQVTVTFSAARLIDNLGSTHGMGTYRQGFELAFESNRPELQQVKHSLSETLGFSGGARVTSREFSAVREIHGLDAVAHLAKNRTENAVYDSTLGLFKLDGNPWIGPAPLPDPTVVFPTAGAGGR